MPSPSLHDDPDYWRKRAEEARTIADEMRDVSTKNIILGIALSYEQIAKWVEMRTTGGPR
jgi:hypothetical protein